MNKERLEDVRETMAYIKMCESKEMHNQEQADMAKCYLIERHGDWLIEQAERVQELEENLDHGAKVAVETARRLHQEREQNKRYREALEFYADEETYETKFATDTDEIYDPFTLIELDEGKKARKALEGEQ